MRCAVPELVYSPYYQQRFINNRTLDPTRMSPELLAYSQRDVSEEELDFFEWKKKYLPAFLN